MQYSGTGADLSNTSVPVILPGTPENLVTDWPEGYDAQKWGTSGNITVNGTLTFNGTEPAPPSRPTTLSRRDSVSIVERDVNNPPYTIHNGEGNLALKTLAMNATHAGGFVELDVHNMFGYMEERATHLALNKVRPDERPFIISRSTFPSSGHWTGHWVR